MFYGISRDSLSSSSEVRIVDGTKGVEFGTSWRTYSGIEPQAGAGARPSERRIEFIGTTVCGRFVEQCLCSLSPIPTPMNAHSARGTRVPLTASQARFGRSHFSGSVLKPQDADKEFNSANPVGKPSNDGSNRCTAEIAHRMETAATVAGGNAAVSVPSLSTEIARSSAVNSSALSGPTSSSGS